jgi:hypothetical protein
MSTDLPGDEKQETPRGWGGADGAARGRAADACAEGSGVGSAADRQRAGRVGNTVKCYLRTGKLPLRQVLPLQRKLDAAEAIALFDSPAQYNGAVVQHLLDGMGIHVSLRTVERAAYARRARPPDADRLRPEARTHRRSARDGALPRRGATLLAAHLRQAVPERAAERLARGHRRRLPALRRRHTNHPGRQCARSSSRMIPSAAPSGFIERSRILPRLGRAAAGVRTVSRACSAPLRSSHELDFLLPN